MPLLRPGAGASTGVAELDTAVWERVEGDVREPERLTRYAEELRASA